MGWFPNRCITDCHFMQIDLKRMLSNDVIRRIAYVTVALVFAFLSDFAKADYPPQVLFRAASNALTPADAWFTAKAPACEYYLNQLMAGSPGRVVTLIEVLNDIPSDPGFGCVYSDSAKIGDQTVSGYNRLHCPSGDLINGMCTGDPPPPSCVAGPDSNTGTQRVILGEGSQVCIDSCIYPLISPMSAYYDGAWRTAGDVGNNTGISCTGSPAPATPTPEDECTKQGKSHGTVNGAVVCVDAGTPNSAPVKTSETSSTQTTTNITNEGDTTTVNSTSTSSTSVTVNGSGGVTSETTSTTENPDGSTTVQTEQKEQTKGEFCAENPTHAICQQKTDCDKYPDSIACQIMGDAPELGEGDGIPTIEREIGSIVLPSLPQSSGCPAPLSISIGGRTITISYQPFCDYAEAFRPLVLAGAWLTAAFIIVGFRGGQD